MVSRSVTNHLSAQSRGPGEVFLPHMRAFAAQIRLARAVLGWSQTELGRRISLTSARYGALARRLRTVVSRRPEGGVCGSIFSAYLVAHS